MKKKAPKGWVSIAQFAKLTGNSDKTIGAAIRRGVIPAERIGTGATAPYYLNPQPAAEVWRSKLHTSHPTSRPVIAKLDQYIGTFKPVTNPPQMPEVLVEDKMSYDKAALMEKVAKAKMTELDLAEKEGRLVDKAQVHEQLFAFHQHLRDALLAIPNRVADQVIAEADNRTAVHNTIYNAIAEALTRLADMKEL